MQHIESCRIRAMEARDLTNVLEWRNDPDVRQHMLTQHEITLDEHQKWFERAAIDSSRRYMIVEEDTIPLGFVQFSNAAAGGISDWGFYTVPGAAKGSGRKLGCTALNFAFGNLALHKVCGQALAFNQASIRFHRALGFKEEGRLRDQLHIGGAYHDLICFGLLAPEWYKRSSK